MLLVSIIVVIIFVVVLSVLLTPLTIKIDTTDNIYQVKLAGLVKAWPGWEHDTFCLHVKVPLKHFRITRFRSKKKTEGVTEKEKKAIEPKKKKDKSGEVSATRVLSVLKSFKLKDFRLEMDTDDYVANGQLYPLFWWINQQGLNCSINFNGHNHLSLVARSSLMRMGMAWLKGA